MRRIAALAAGLLTALLPVVSVFPASASASPAPALTRNLSAAGDHLAMARYLASHWASRLTAAVTVNGGDTLSGLAATYLGSAADWPTLWWANHASVPDPDVLAVGTVLRFPVTGWATAALTARAVSAIPQPKVITVSSSPPPGAHTSHFARPAIADASFSGSGGFQSCVISHESSGDAQVMNSSGHYGLYQFSFSTWTGHGGPASEFGHASVAEQNQVFENTVAADGDSDWRPYDGCRL